MGLDIDFRLPGSNLPRTVGWDNPFPVDVSSGTHEFMRFLFCA